MPGLMENSPISSDTRPARADKVVVVGIYGVAGSGKTFLLEQLKQQLEREKFAFYDGSQVIATVVPGGLDAFRKLEEQEQMHWRKAAIDRIKQDCVKNGVTAVVAGHFMFWSEDNVGRPIITQNDLQTYTHILYLDTPTAVVAQRRQDDKERSRPSMTTDHLRKWQQEEKNQLVRICRDHGILFLHVCPHAALQDSVSALLRDFQHHSEERNLQYAESALDESLAAGKEQLKTLLVLDADKTLASEDTGALFWKQLRSSRQIADVSCPLRKLFSSRLGYSYTAFRQAMLLYEEAANNQEYDILCEEVASLVSIHPEFVSLLQLVAGQDHVRAVVVSCGLRRVWEIALERAGLSESMKVIAGGRISDGYVVTGAVKAALVTRARKIHKLYVWAFGDSVLDLDMLRNSDRAIVVVGDEENRSKTMDAALQDAIDTGGLQARQALLPRNVSPRLNTTKLPLIQLTGAEFVAEMTGPRTQHAGLRLVHATNKKAAKLLMTPMRDAACTGPTLREAHRRVGWYLATELLAEAVGVENHPIAHVQGHITSGWRLLHEQQTLIVALMRGGEAMAFGVNDAYPTAMFLHAYRPENISLDSLTGKLTVILVDSVVNSGKTIVQFVQHIRSLHATIRIIVVAGVVQAQCMSAGLKVLSQDGQLGLVALRQSDNKFTGRGGTDTGNRLFNTTHLA